jgi:hypothetical protein
VLKNSFRGISPAKFARKLLNVRSPQTLKSTEITALVPFQQPQAISLIDLQDELQLDSPRPQGRAPI